ncbi:MAG: UDP-glucose 4-epimerase [Chloroflexi bacterium RBG_16_52_11]|nr:MAG: UDP-glucose 4-epimerase [Chloroflexi bacterium RBG_16_52_11]
MKILVTGGAGFIGSHVVDAYINEGHEVLLMDDLSSGKVENINLKARFFKVDIRSTEAREIISREKPDVINHHAAQISVPASVENPLLDADINVKGFLNVLEAGKAFRIKKVIFISSGGAIYGEVGDSPATEDFPVRPLSPYAVTKAAGENYLSFYKNQYGLDFTVLRYANVYGPRQIPHGEAGVVAIFMERLMSGKSCTVYSFPDEPKGMERDYCYVGDVAMANVFALKKDSSGVFNIGTGIPTRTRDLFDIVYDTLNSIKPLSPSLKIPDSSAARPGDIKRNCLDSAKAFRVLGWKEEAGLKQGIEKTVLAVIKKDKDGNDYRGGGN